MILKIHSESGVFELVGTVVGITISALIGDWIPLMTTLFVLNGSDILTGLLKGGTQKDIGSGKFYAGIKKKVGQWVLIVVANSIDVMVFDKAPIAKTGLVSFLVATEGISITENLAEIGVPIPAFITKYLSQIRDTNNKEDLDKQK